MSEDERSWVPLRTLAVEEEARFIQGMLESEGIPCMLESMKFTAEPVNLGMMSEIRLHVLEEDLERAEALLAAADSSST